MKFKMLKNIAFILFLSSLLYLTSFYNFVLGFSGISTIKTEGYNERRAQHYALLKSQAERFQLTTDDNVNIAGLIVDRPQSDAVLLICHGYRQSKEHLSVLADLFNEYTIVLIDLRAHGDSGGNISFGFHEHKDISAALNFLKNDIRFKNKKMYGLGISMGAASLSNATAKGCKFDALVLDSCFATIDSKVIAKFVKVPRMFFGLGKFLFKIIRGVDIDLIKPGHYLSSIDCPVMIMHSHSDKRVAVSHAYELYDKISCSKKSLVLCEGLHGRLFRYDSSFYKKAIIDFLSKL